MSETKPITRRQLLASASLAGLTACSSTPKLVIGSKDSIESRLISEITSQLLEKKLSARIDRQFGIVGSTIPFQSVQGGDMDLYPEYTRLAYKVLLKVPEQSDLDRVLGMMQETLKVNAQAGCLPFLGFDAAYVPVVLADHATLGHLSTLSAACAVPGGLRLGCTSEFAQSPEGYNELKMHYRLSERNGTRLEPISQLYFGLREHRIDLLISSATDPRLRDARYKVLEDDLHQLGPNRCTLVYRLDAARKYPSILPVLESLSGKLDQAAMLTLNGEVEVNKRAFNEVAAEWLTKTKLV